MGWSPQLYAAPTGGVVSAGVASITTTGKDRSQTTLINQSSQRAVIDWQKFDLEPGDTVNFQLPNPRAATLNNVSGGKSNIGGTINSNGTVYFVNQNGFVFGAQSVVTAKNLIISTQAVNAGYFMYNEYQENEIFAPLAYEGAGNLLQGKIKLADHGVLVVTAPQVETDKTAEVTANFGNVVLVAGVLSRLKIDDAGRLQMQYGPALPHALVKNAGNIYAAGGNVSLLAKGSLYARVAAVVNDGRVDTSLPDGIGGVITIGDDTGTADLAHGWVKVGQQGTLIYNQNSPQADLVIDDDFLQRINYQPGQNLIFHAGKNLIVTAALPGENLSHLDLKAEGDIWLKAPMVADKIALTAATIRADNNLSLGRGGLSVIAFAKANKNQDVIILAGDEIRTNDGGNVTLTANNGGAVSISSRIYANNFTVDGYGGGEIKLFGRVELRNATERDSNFTLYQHDQGNILVQDRISANNITVTADDGAINFFDHVVAFKNDDNEYNLDKNGNLRVKIVTNTQGIEFHDEVYASNMLVQTANGTIKFDRNAVLMMIDPTPRVNYPEDRHWVADPSDAKIYGGSLKVTSLGHGDISFDREIQGTTRYTRYHHNDGFQPIPTLENHEKLRPSSIIVHTGGAVHFGEYVAAQPGGTFDIVSHRSR